MFISAGTAAREHNVMRRSVWSIWEVIRRAFTSIQALQLSERMNKPSLTPEQLFEGLFPGELYSEGGAPRLAAALRALADGLHQPDARDEPRHEQLGQRCQQTQNSGQPALQAVHCPSKKSLNEPAGIFAAVLTVCPISSIINHNISHSKWVWGSIKFTAQ